MTVGRVEEEGRAPVGRAREIREVGSVQVFQGEDPCLPRWQRTIPLNGPPGWPEGWMEALEREIGGWDGRLSRTEPDLVRAGRILVDTFALSDFLRHELRRWCQPGRRRPEAVMPRGLDLVDPGHLFPVLSGPAEIKGRPWETTVVHDGVLEPPPSTAAVKKGVGGSWRNPDRLPWGQLKLTAEKELWLPAIGPEAWVMTRALPFTDILLGSGIRIRKGRVAATWGPIPLPAPAWWLRRIEALAGPAVPDATGIPVVVPAAWVKTGS